MLRAAALIVAGLSVSVIAGTPTPTPISGEDKPLRAQAVIQDAPGMYFAQLLGDMDRPVGDGIQLVGVKLAAKTNDKSQLEMDVKGDGKFRVLSKREVLTVTLKGEGEKPKTQAIKLLVIQREDGAWVYRNVSQLLLRIDNEQFTVIDANANGVYNEPGIDGVAWQGETWLFPLPAESERWCSATQDFTGLKFGPWGENPVVSGKTLATAVAIALPILKGVNEERVKIGLTPRPEDPKLSAELQKHCVYMNGIGQLTHGEEKDKPGYSPEGHQAGMRSILSMGSAPPSIAASMIQTYFHRQDVIRPNTLAFGVGYEGKYGGIDGRTNVRKAAAADFPVLCPVPGQTGIGLTYGKEGPDACPGDPAAGFPITVYFHTNKLKLTSHSLKAVGLAGAPSAVPHKPGAGETVECYVFDPQTGASNDMTGFQHCVCIIAKDPLKSGVEYEVTMNVEVEGKPWSKTWRFSTGAAKRAKR